MKSSEIFDFIRPTLGVTQPQIDALYRILGRVDIEDVAAFLGMPVESEPSGFTLSETSLKRLEGVAPDLVNVVKRALELSAVDFVVLEGVRTKEQAYINYGKGRTAATLAAKGVPEKYAQPAAAKVTWLNNPLASKHMTGLAVDIAPYPIDWNDLERFDQVAAAMFQAADELGVSITWGADWDRDGQPRERGESDSPHFELV